jgi:hypothetical protein
MGQAIQKVMGGIQSATPDSPSVPYSKFTDLYDSCPWDVSAVQKLIANGVLAPIIKGSEIKPSVDGGGVEECPICFLFNSQVCSYEESLHVLNVAGGLAFARIVVVSPCNNVPVFR